MTTGNTLSVLESRSGSVCVVTLAGRIDSTNAHDLYTRLAQLLGAGEKTLLVDFADVRYLTSAAFRSLLMAAAEAKRTEARLALCRIQGHVRELFELSGLLEAFAIHGTRDEAIAKLG